MRLHETFAGWVIATLTLVAGTCTTAHGQAAPEPLLPAPVSGEVTVAHTNVVVVPDPLPHLQALLTDPRLVRAVREGPTGAFIRAETGDADAADPEKWWLAVEEQKAFVPQRVVIAFPEGTMRSVGKLAIAAIQGMPTVAPSPFDQTAPDEPAEMADRAKRTAEALAAVEQPRGVAWVQLRSWRDAVRVHSTLRLGLQYASDRFGWPLDVQGDELRLTVDLAPSDDAPDARLDLLSQILRIPSTDPAFSVAAEALGKLKFDLLVARHKEGILVRLGPPVQGEPLSLRAIGDEVRATTDGTFFVGRLDFREMRDAVAEVTAAMEQHVQRIDKTANMLRYAARGVLDAGRDFLLTLNETPDRTTAFLRRRDGGVEAELVETGFRPSPALKDSPIWRLIPADARSYYVTTCLSFAATSGDLAAPMANGLEIAAFDDEAQARVRALREGYLPRMQKSMSRGHGYVYESRGKLARLDITLDGSNEPKKLGPVDSAIELSLIIGGEPSTEMRTILRDLVSVTSVAMADLVDASPPVDGKARAERALREADLGLGVPTDLVDVNELSAMFGGGFRYDADGDLNPHVMYVDGAAVFSSSARLSKSLLAARASPRSIPSYDPARGVAVGAGELDGRVFGDFFRQMAVMVAVASDKPADGPEARLVSALGSLFDVVAPIVVITTERGNEERRTTGVLRFAEQ